MNYVIVGGVAAGMSAAMQIVRTDPQAHITVLEKGEDYSYGQCGFPYVINGLIPDVRNVIARSIDTFRNRYGIDAKINSHVRELDLDNQIIKGVYTDRIEPFSIPYDRLLIATGASPIIPNWPGSHLKGIHTLKTIPDTLAILKDVTKNVKRIVIVGGGYIGLEMADSFASLDKQVTIIQRGNQLANVFDAEISNLIQKEAIEHGVQVVLNESVQAFEGKEQVQEVVTDQGKYEADLVLIAVGIRPNTNFLSDSVIHMNHQGAIRVNAYMETNIDHIYAAGDCATHYHLVKEKDDYIPLGTTANKQGNVAGRNMAGLTTTFKGVVGTSIIKFFSLSLGRTGLSEKEARALQLSFETETIQTRDIAGYYPGSDPIIVKLIYEKESKRILGGQIVGTKGVDKRIDVLATALYNKMTMPQLLDLDLAYSPPYNGVWDPLQQVARRV